MPELPEVETVARELDRKLRNKTVKSVRVLRAKMVGVGPATLPPKRSDEVRKVVKFVRLLEGRKIRSVARRAKLLIFDFYYGDQIPGLAPLFSFAKASADKPAALSHMGEGMGERRGMKKTESNPLHKESAGINSLLMLVHLKMTGQFVYFKKNELERKIKIANSVDSPDYVMPCEYTHAIFTFTDGSKLFYNDLRQFGYLKLITGQELPRVRELREFGPEPLDKKFTPFAFFTIVKNANNRKIPIKVLLMDSKFIAGIGNIYSDEILFHAKISPGRKPRDIKKPEWRRIYSAIKKVLKKAVAARGSSVGDFIRTDGSFGGMGKYHYVYGRRGRKCKVCDTMIKTAKFGGRTGSFCPRCQH